MQPEKILIADDSKKDREMIVQAVMNAQDQLFPMVFAESSSFEDVDPEIPYFACFIDIELGDRSGIELAGMIHDHHPETLIIFVTNHDELVFQSFQANPFYFVRKSTLSDDMNNAVRLMKKHYDNLNDSFSCSYNGEVFSILYSDLCWVQKEHNDLYLGCVNDTYRIRMSLSSIEPELAKHGFFRISNSAMINMKYAEKIKESSIFVHGREFHIPRRNLPETKRRLMQQFRGEYI